MSDFHSLRDFSFRNISHIDESEKIYYPFRVSGINDPNHKKTTSTTTTITTIKNKTHTEKSVDINFLPNIIDQTIRENFIQENQTLFSDLHHFPKSLIIDNTIKITTTSAVVDLLPENYNVLEIDIKSFNQNDQHDRKVSQNLRTRTPKNKSRKQQYVINRAQKLNHMTKN